MNAIITKMAVTNDLGKKNRDSTSMIANKRFVSANREPKPLNTQKVSPNSMES